MFNGTLTLVGKRAPQGFISHKFKGTWGLKLVDVIVVDFPNISGSSIKLLKKIWCDLGSHNRVVKLLATSFEPQLLRPVFVAEFAKCSLRQFYTENVFPSVVARHIRQIAEGIDYLHERNIIHCNLNPETISVMKDENVKLSHFEGAMELENEQQIIVPELYGLPEYLDLDANSNFIYGKKTDMFAVGCVIFEILTGKSFMKFPRDLFGSTPAHCFYTNVLLNKGLYPAHNLSVEYLEGRPTSLEKRLAELQNSVLGGCREESIEIIRSLVLRDGNERTNANSLLKSKFCDDLNKLFDTSDSQKWIPDCTANPKQKSFKLNWDHQLKNAKRYPSELIDFEQIFECPQSVTLENSEIKMITMDTRDLQPNRIENIPTVNSNTGNVIASTSSGFLTSQIAINQQHCERYQLNSCTNAAKSGAQFQSASTSNGNIAQPVGLPQRDLLSTAIFNTIGEEWDVQNITFDNVNGDASYTINVPLDLQDQQGLPIVNLATGDGNFVVTLPTQHAPLTTQIVNVNKNSTEPMVFDSGRQNLQLDEDHAENDASAIGTANENHESGPSGAFRVNTSEQTSRSRPVPSTTTTPPSLPQQRRSNAANRNQNSKKAGRPKGSYCAYNEIRILQSGAFQCTNCNVIFENRTKSLHHRTYYVKNNRCKTTLN